MVTVKNTGNSTLNSVTLTNATLGPAGGIPLPQTLGSIGPNGGTANATLDFSYSAGAPGTLVQGSFKVTHASGSGSGVVKVSLPQ